MAWIQCYKFQFSFKVFLLVLNFLHSDLILMFTVIFVFIKMYVTSILFSLNKGVYKTIAK